MAAPTLSVLSSPNFHKSFEDLVHYEIRRVSRLLGESYLRRCDFSDQFCDCRELGTVHHLPSEQEFCERHFQIVTKRGN